MSTRYRVTIHAEGKLYKTYRTQGDVVITASERPLVAAAQALISRGATPDAPLCGSYEGAQISPVALSRLVAPYRAPRTNHREPQRNVD